MSFEGLQLGRYQLHQKVGSGGMGEVYLAEDTRIRRQVAIKIVRNEPASPYTDSESGRLAAQLFEREMKIISQLDHPYILPLYDYGETLVDGTKITYMVMPYRPEGSLLTWLRQRQSSALLAPRDVVTFIEQAASALHHAHERQVIHQDIKPSNFLIRVRPEEPNYPDLLLTDFGISRSTATTSNTSQLIQGTPTYMAPEQWEGHPTYASDQYALAVMAYELLVGRPPFQGKPGPIMFQHMTATPPLPSNLNPALPAVIDAVLLRALAKKPDERFDSVSAFATVLQQAINDESLTLSGGRPDVMAKVPYPDFKPGMSEAEKEAMAVCDLNTLPTPTTPAVLPDLINFPQSAVPPTAISPAATPAALQKMSQGEPDQPLAFSYGAPSAAQGVPPTPFVFPGAGTTPARQLTPSAIRLLLIVLVLVLGAGSTLLYAFAIAPHRAVKNGPASQQTGTTLVQESRATTAVHVTIEATPRSTAPDQNLASAQTPTTVDTVTIQVQATATDQTQSTTIAQGTTQAQATATADALGLAHAEATATARVLASTTPLYRLYSSKQGDHFYTTSASERDRADTQDSYTYEGIACYVMSSHAANTIPLYRLYSSKQGDHFYTASASERDRADTQDSYTYEGIAAYVFAS
jgi:serine/threonine protein kinase